MAARQQERWLALEFVGVVLVRTIYGFREQRGLLGPQNYAAMLAAFGMLSALVLFEPTADLAAVIGALILLAVLLRPTGKPGELSTLGADAARSVAAFTENVGNNPPSIAKGYAG